MPGTCTTGTWPHVDFHTPLGALTFELTRIGFAMVGTIPLAALAGPLLLVVPALAAGAVAAARRLPLLPAVLFTVYVTLLVIMPANVGDQPNAYSLAMAYNRWGWSALTILCLLLFVPPRSGVARPWIEPLLGAALLLFAFYLKITYAIASGAAIVAAIVVMSARAPSAAAVDRGAGCRRCSTPRCPTAAPISPTCGRRPAPATRGPALPTRCCRW